MKLPSHGRRSKEGVPGAPPALPGNGPPVRRGPPPIPAAVANDARRPRVGYVILAASAAGLCCIGLLVWGLSSLRFRPRPESVKASEVQPEGQRVVSSPPSTASPLRPSDDQRGKVGSPMPRPAPPVRKSPARVDAARPASTPKSATADEPGAADPQPFKDVEARGKRLQLPSFAQDIAKPSGSAVLARIPARSKDLELELRGCNSVFDPGADVTLKRNSNPSEILGWTVFARAVNAVSQTPQPIAHFSFSGETLQFNWDEHASSDLHPALLRFCSLRIKSKEQAIDCSLFQPDQLEPVVPNVKERRFVWNFTNAKAPYPNLEKLHFDAIVKGLPGKDAPVVQHLSMGEAVSLAVSGSESSDSHLNLRMKILQKDEVLSLQVEYLSEVGPPELGKHKATSRKSIAPEHPCSLSDVKTWLKTVQRKMASAAKRQDSDPIMGAARRASSSNTRRAKGRRSGSSPSTSGLGGDGDLSQTEASLTKLQSLLEQISQSTRIGLRVYIEIDGQSVDLLASRFD
jgi:hypothetical protein